MDAEKAADHIEQASSIHEHQEQQQKDFRAMLDAETALTEIIEQKLAQHNEQVRSFHALEEQQRKDFKDMLDAEKAKTKIMLEAQMAKTKIIEEKLAENIEHISKTHADLIEQQVVAQRMHERVEELEQQVQALMAIAQGKLAIGAPLPM